MMERELEPEYMDTVDEATSYDAMDHSLPNQAFVDRLIELGASGHMLDLGCGPGHIPPMIAARLPAASLVGLDAAQTMLDLAEERLKQSPHRDRIQYVLSDAKYLPFDDDEFDCVMSNTVLHHIPEPLLFLQEAARVLKPNGLLFIRDLFRPDSPEAALALVAQHAAEAAPGQQELFRASLHAALRPEELLALAKAAGLDTAEVVLDSDRHMSLIKRSRPI